MKTTPYTEKNNYAFNNAPRCMAKTRRGTACQCPAIRGKRRCRLHGCGKGSGAPKGNAFAVTHGQTTAKIKKFRLNVRQVLKEALELAYKIT